MPVPAEITAPFEVVQTETVFEFPVVVFDTPADFGHIVTPEQGQQHT